MNFHVRFLCKMLAISLLILTYFRTVNAASSCHNGWVLHGNSCYLFTAANETWADAMNHCKALGAHLVEIQTSKEDHFILNRLRNVLRTGKDYWLGSTDIASEGTWEWINSRTLVTYTNWAPNQPQGGTRDNCLSLWAKQLYLWDDTECYEHHAFVCEEELDTEIIG